MSPEEEEEIGSEMWNDERAYVSWWEMEILVPDAVTLQTLQRILVVTKDKSELT